MLPFIYPVYPRVYGEHDQIAFFHLFYIGLSPCVRGTLVACGASHWCTRFIPVCTGNTHLDLSS